MGKRAEKARALIRELADQGRPRWRMSIPADPENDCDLVLSSGLDELEQEGAQLRLRVEELEHQLRATEKNEERLIDANKPLLVRAVTAEKRVEELEAENERWLDLWRTVRDAYVPDLRDENKPLAIAASYTLLHQRAERAERAERERDEHKANEEFAREMLDRVVIQGGAESWTTREMRDWCCDYKDFKNGYPVSFIRAHADHANCGHRECDGQDEPADRWVHRKIERERDEARAIRREVMLRLQTLIDFCYDKVQWSNGEFIKLLRESGDYLAALSQREEAAP